MLQTNSDFFLFVFFGLKKIQTCDLFVEPQLQKDHCEAECPARKYFTNLCVKSRDINREIVHCHTPAELYKHTKLHM